MKIVFAFGTLLLSIILLLSCTQKANQTYQQSDFNFSNFFLLTQTDSIYINTRFSECGEWGGHKEEIIINADKERKLYVHYKVYPYNCDSLKFYYGNENLKPKVDKTMNLTDNGKKSISDYIQRLTQSKMKEIFGGNSGNSFSVIKSDSTLIIKVYDINQNDINSYNKLVSELFK